MHPLSDNMYQLMFCNVKIGKNKDTTKSVVSL
uniref:Uncharacterized protein n=1 Tax=Siphoviridae sp. ct87j35 TaxID=2825356 RepID=A0A8S5V4Y1_9CAUD|nr:MAG TPA: hypothetical protein [Siphoviridae sp. ct87j35]